MIRAAMHNRVTHAARSIRRLAGTAMRFGLVGALATLVHTVCVYAFALGLGAAPLAANTGAFLVAFLVSFTGHHYWTFGRRQPAQRALWRFFIVAGTGFAVSTLALAAALHGLGLPRAVALIIGVLVVWPTTFTLSALWAFAARPAARDAAVQPSRADR